jgi:hypothetical protein
MGDRYDYRFDDEGVMIVFIYESDPLNEVTLDADEQRRVGELFDKHDQEMQAMLRGFIVEARK